MSDDIFNIKIKQGDFMLFKTDHKIGTARLLGNRIVISVGPADQVFVLNNDSDKEEINKFIREQKILVTNKQTFPWMI